MRVVRRLQVGRDPSTNDIAINDPLVSRRHLELLAYAEGQVQVRDLGSTNGVFVDEQRTEAAFLQPGMQIRIGNTVVPWESYMRTEAQVAPPPPSPPTEPPAYQAPPQQHAYPPHAANPGYGAGSHASTAGKANPAIPEIVAAGVLLIGFFLPWISFFGQGVSGFDIAKEVGSNTPIGVYLLWLFPISALIIGGLSFQPKPSTITPRSIFCFVPLGLLVATIIYSIAEGAADFSGLFEVLSIGGYLTIAASIGLTVLGGMALSNKSASA